MYAVDKRNLKLNDVLIGLPILSVLLWEMGGWMCSSERRCRKKSSQLEKATLDCFAKTVFTINPADLFINPK